MLVLSRKIGEQIVLPGCGVTIAVVRVDEKRVRLGIEAPPETLVHRREVWDRVSAGKGLPSQPAPTNHPSVQTAGTSDTAPGSFTELAERLVERIHQRTHGSIRSLSVEAGEGRVIVHGAANSYYARQLAYVAAVEVLGPAEPNGTGELDLDIDIDVLTATHD